jgi:hypothetical protein
MMAPKPTQKQFEQRKEDFSKTNLDIKAQKRAVLMANFDDIPIHQLHKADGYYQGQNIAEMGAGVDEGEDNLQESTLLPANTSLKDQVFDQRWKVRLNAFQAINR